MQQKDYIALAAAFKQVKPAYTPHDDTKDHGGISYQQWTRDVVAVMGVLIADNPRFHKGKFMKALGVANIMLP